MLNLPTSAIVAAILYYVRTLNWGSLEVNAKVGQNSIYEFQGKFINSSGIIDNNINVILNTSKVDIYTRRKIRQVNESPIDGIKYMRSYNTPCIELTLGDFLEGRNNLLNQLITDLSLSLTDWEDYVVDLLSILAATNEDGSYFYSLDERKAAHQKINTLIKETKKYNNLPQLGSFWGNLFSGTWTESSVYTNTRDQLSKALFLTYQEEFLIPLVAQVYPNPIPQDKNNNNRPTCYDIANIGVCCLYDEVIKEILPGLNKTVKIYKECLVEVDKADCLNRTKLFSLSREDATPGRYDGAEFYSASENTGCDVCKNPVSIVFCSDNVPFVFKNKKSADIREILDNAFEPTNIQYFDNANDATIEHNKRLDNGSCGYFQEELEQPPPPSIEPGNCDDDTISVLVYPPTGCNIDADDKINYHFYIDGTLRQPQSIAWTPGPSNSVDSYVTAVFDKKFENDSILVRASFIQTDNATGSIVSGPESVHSNTIEVNCEPSPSPSVEPSPSPSVEPSPTPTPEPEPGFPVSVILSNFTGAGGETCNIYNGTYTVNAPYINGEASNYDYPLPPQNEYVISNSVDVGYDPNNDDIYVCLNLTTPDGSSRLCQQYDIDWNTGNYAVAWGLGFPSTPWCIGDISLEFSF